MAQNSTGTARKRGPGRPFASGVSGNPGGRPHSFSAYIREQTQDGKEIADMAIATMRNKKLGGRLRLQAGEFLSDRGWGKAEQFATIRTQEDAMTVIQIIRASAIELWGQDGCEQLDELVKAKVRALAAGDRRG